MLGDHERREVAGRQRHAHMVERLGRDPYARRHVSALTGLPDIVEQGAEQEAVVIGSVRESTRRERVFVATSDQAAHLDEGRREMRVDREAVVRIALGTAADVSHAGMRVPITPRRSRASRAARPRLTRSDDPHERPPGAVGPRDRVGDRGHLERVEEPGVGPVARLSDRGERLQRLVRSGERLRRPGRHRCAPDGTGQDVLGDPADRPGVLEDRAHQPVLGDQAGFVSEPHRPGDGRLQFEGRRSPCVPVSNCRALRARVRNSSAASILLSLGRSQQGITGDGSRPAAPPGRRGVLRLRS